LCKLDDVTQGEVAPALLHGTDVGAMQIRTLRELFLRQLNIFATLPDASTELFQSGMVGWH
jgi:hypothetical protein